MHRGVLAGLSRHLVPGDGGVGHSNGARHGAILEREHHTLVVDGGVSRRHTLEHTCQVRQFITAQGIDHSSTHVLVLVGLLQGSD